MDEYINDYNEDPLFDDSDSEADVYEVNGYSQ